MVPFLERAGPLASGKTRAKKLVYCHFNPKYSWGFGNYLSFLLLQKKVKAKRIGSLEPEAELKIKKGVIL